MVLNARVATRIWVSNNMDDILSHKLYCLFVVTNESTGDYCTQLDAYWHYYDCLPTVYLAWALYNLPHYPTVPCFLFCTFLVQALAGVLMPTPATITHPTLFPRPCNVFCYFLIFAFVAFLCALVGPSLNATPEEPLWLTMHLSMYTYLLFPALNKERGVSSDREVYMYLHKVQCDRNYPLTPLCLAIICLRSSSVTTHFDCADFCFPCTGTYSGADCNHEMPEDCSRDYPGSGSPIAWKQWSVGLICKPLSARPWSKKTAPIISPCLFDSWQYRSALRQAYKACREKI